MKILGILVLILYIALFGLILQVIKNKQKIKELDEKYNIAMTKEIIGENSKERIIPDNVKK